MCEAFSFVRGGVWERSCCALISRGQQATSSGKPIAHRLADRRQGPFSTVGRRSIYPQAVPPPIRACNHPSGVGNDFGTAMWQLMVLQAPAPWDDMQCIGGVLPGARILLRADGEERVKAVLGGIDAIEQIGINPCTVATTYWRTVGNRLAARLPLPAYTAERHAAHLARGVLR
jgi:hypothetical protein